MSSSSPQTYLDEQVFLLLSQNYALTRKIAERELALIGITLAEYTLLRIIENTPKITASEARKRLFASAPSVAVIVKSLSRKALIARTSDQVDIRRQPMHLTPTGRLLIQRARRALQNALREIAVPEQEIRSLITQLSSVLNALTAYHK